MDIGRRRLVTRRTMAWVFFGLLFALTPIYIDVVGQAAAGGHSIDWLEILQKGEQFIVGFVVALGALGEVLAATFSDENKNLAFGFASGALLVALANLFAYLVAPHAALTFLGWTTPILLAITSFVCIVCVRMAAGR